MNLPRLALPLLVTCLFLSSTTRAATLETFAGAAVSLDTMPEKFAAAVSGFEEDSVVVLDGVTGNIVDVFVSEEFARVLGYGISSYFGSIISSSGSGIVYSEPAIQFVCVKLLTRNEVSAKVSTLNCKVEGNISESRQLASVRWMARLQTQETGVLSLETSATGGALKLAFEKRNYILRFTFTAEELAQRRAGLEHAKQEEERKRAEEQRAAEERRALRVEESRRRAEAERPILEGRFKAVTDKVIMLDGVLALPVKSVATVIGWYSQTEDSGCIQVSDRTYFPLFPNEIVCNEDAWSTTNYVSLRVSGQLYVPVPVLNKLFTNLALRHDTATRTLSVRLTTKEGSEDDAVSTETAFSLRLPASVPAHRTVTQTRIFKFSKDSTPKCSTATVVRSAYTATIAVGSATEFNHFTLKFSNTSNAPINIIWDDSVLRLPNGQRSAVVQGTTDLSTRYQSQPPTVVAPRASHTAILLAATKIVSLGTPSSPAYYAKLFDITAQFNENRDSLVVTGATATVSGVLAVRVNGKKVFENFSVTCTAKPGEYRR